MQQKFLQQLDKMVERGVFRINEHDEVEIVGEAQFSFLCALGWPFIDSYFVTAMILFTLQPSRSVEENLVYQRAQWLGTVSYGARCNW